MEMKSGGLYIVSKDHDAPDDIVMDGNLKLPHIRNPMINPDPSFQFFDLDVMLMDPNGNVVKLTMAEFIIMLKPEFQQY
ncbi:MAG: hypothetical protein LIO93_08520 [Bacteroidales bacterium]|nr:hypothetical protein [Bacteroidales bacterium]